jgi:flagellar protein FliT
MDQEDLLASYEAAARFSSGMLAAARASDWEDFAALEAACATEIKRIRVGGIREPLTPPQRSRKIEVLKTILANDREIRFVTESWISHLSTLAAGSGAALDICKTAGQTVMG